MSLYYITIIYYYLIKNKIYVCIYIYILNNTTIYIYMYIYVCVCVCVCMPVFYINIKICIYNIVLKKII
jgi:hypothetical protein